MIAQLASDVRNVPAHMCPLMHTQMHIHKLLHYARFRRNFSLNSPDHSSRNLFSFV